MPYTDHDAAEADIVAARKAALLPTSPSFITGRYYAGVVTIAATVASAVTADRLYLLPFYAAVQTTFDRITVNITVAGTAGHVGRLGIYGSVNGVPSGAPLVDTGTFSVAAISTPQLTISQTLHGLFFLAFTAQSGTVTMNPTGAHAALFGSTSPTALPSVYAHQTATHAATSALPTLGALTYVNGSAPHVTLRAV